MIIFTIQAAFWPGWNGRGIEDQNLSTKNEKGVQVEPIIAKELIQFKQNEPDAISSSSL